MQIWMAVLAMQLGSCRAGSLCLVSGMDIKTTFSDLTLYSDFRVGMLCVNRDKN